MADSLLQDFTAPYSPFESFMYDYFIAGAVADFVKDAMDQFLEKMPRGAKILEVGCGGGHLATEIMRRRPDLELTGLDLSHEQIARAKKRNRNSPGSPRFVQGSALELPFDEGSFDGLFSVASIKHWPDQRLGVSECVRVLRPGGMLLIAEADRGCKLEDARNFVSHWRIPAALRPIALMGFRTYVAGQGLDDAEAMAHLKSQPLKDCTVQKQPGLPSLMLIGKKKGKKSP